MDNNIKECKGKWVAIRSANDIKVIASANTRDEVALLARNNGCRNPVIFYVSEIE